MATCPGASTSPAPSRQVELGRSRRARPRPPAQRSRPARRGRDGRAPPRPRAGSPTSCSARRPGARARPRRCWPSPTTYRSASSTTSTSPIPTPWCDRIRAVDDERRHGDGDRPQPDHARARPRSGRRRRPGRAPAAGRRSTRPARSRSLTSTPVGRPRRRRRPPSRTSSRPTGSGRLKCGPCTRRRLGRYTSVPVDGSDQATLRHTGRSAESCFLPDLTRFAGLRCAGPDPRHHVRVVRAAVRASSRNSAPHTWIWGTGHHELPA